MYRDVEKGTIYEAFNGIFSKTPSWNTKYLIKNKLVDYYPGLILAKITDEEALELFHKVLTHADYLFENNVSHSALEDNNHKIRK